MNKSEAKRVVRACVRALPDTAARNLMEHAANETPVILGPAIWHIWSRDGAG